MSLEARAISIRLGEREVLSEASLRLDHGEVLALLGPNGSGKSTLLRTLAGTLRPIRGQVLLDDRPILRTPPRDRARALASVAQHSPIPPFITVREQVWLGRHPHRRWLRAPSDDDRDAVASAIDACDLAEIAERPVETLSGGERQRARIATALAQRPRHLLLDEPLTGLDIEHQLDLLSLLLRINRERGTSILVALHDLDHAARFFPRLALLRAGRFIADGPPAKVLCRSAFESVFRVDGCLSSDLERGQPVVVCSRLCDRAACSAARPAPSTPPDPEPPTVIVPAAPARIR
jgi:iron complex transport system ATP-binding protein